MQDNYLTNDEGEILLKLARENIKTYLEGEEYIPPKNLPKIFHEKLGVFVTLHIYSQLKGCIGYPEPYMPLIDSLMDVSIAAAVDDPRFNPLSLKEFKDVTIEISVLTKPVLVKVSTFDEYLEKINVGVDGLIIENSYHRGLLLPQVPIEQKWDIIDFLEGLCYKAGLYKEAWKEKNTKIYSFQAQIFQEK